jgi:hypothetical protein
MSAPLRLVVHDRTCEGTRRFVPGLSRAWWLGGHLYRALGRIDRAHASASWDDALRWAAEIDGDRPIGELQFWMHGRWGRALIDREPLALESLSPAHPHRALLDALRARLRPSSLVWFRTCETFGANAGQRFARTLADFLGCRVAGHTHVIADWQSGLHTLPSGEAPRWPANEGLIAGSAESPERARWSTPLRPHTIHCLHGRIPEGW